MEILTAKPTQTQYNKIPCTKELPKFERSVSLLCWVYNEEELIEEYMHRANALLESCIEDYEIVVVDDCSTDRTPELLIQLQNQYPCIRMFRNEKNLNVGLSCRKAISLAEKDYIFWQTIDWAYDISNLRSFLELLKKFDIVAGVRRNPVESVSVSANWKPVLALLRLIRIKHLTRRSDTIPKAIISVINYLLIRLLFQVPLSDYQNVVFYPRKWIQLLEYEAKSSFVNPEALIKAYWNEMSIVEVPISFIARQKGDAKGTRIKAIVSSVTDILSCWNKWVIHKNVLRTRNGVIQRLRPDEWEQKLL